MLNLATTGHARKYVGSYAGNNTIHPYVYGLKFSDYCENTISDSMT